MATHLIGYMCYIQYLDFIRFFFYFQITASIDLPPCDTLLFRNDILVIVVYFHFNPIQARGGQVFSLLC